MGNDENGSGRWSILLLRDGSFHGWYFLISLGAGKLPPCEETQYEGNSQDANHAHHKKDVLKKSRFFYAYHSFLLAL